MTINITITNPQPTSNHQSKGLTNIPAAIPVTLGSPTNNECVPLSVPVSSAPYLEDQELGHTVYTPNVNDTRDSLIGDIPFSPIKKRPWLAPTKKDTKTGNNSKLENPLDRTPSFAPPSQTARKQKGISFSKKSATFNKSTLSLEMPCTHDFSKVMDTFLFYVLVFVPFIGIFYSLFTKRPSCRICGMSINKVGRQSITDNKQSWRL